MYSYKFEFDLILDPNLYSYAFEFDFLAQNIMPKMYFCSITKYDNTAKINSTIFFVEKIIKKVKLFKQN